MNDLAIYEDSADTISIEQFKNFTFERAEWDTEEWEILSFSDNDLEMLINSSN